MLLEGPHLLAEALAAGRRIGRIFYLPAWGESSEGREILARAEEAGASLFEVTERLMARAATTESPPRVIATADMHGPTPSPARIRAGILLDELADPGNAGTILRIAWAAGFDAVWSTEGTVDLYAPKVMRAAQGAHFHLSLRNVGRRNLLAEARREGYWLAAAVPGGGKPFWRAELRLPCLIAIGGEARGLDPSLMAAADERVSIPLAEGVDSLNAAVSAGIIAFELARRLNDPPR